MLVFTLFSPLHLIKSKYFTISHINTLQLILRMTLNCAFAVKLELFSHSCELVCHQLREVLLLPVRLSLGHKWGGDSRCLQTHTVVVTLSNLRLGGGRLTGRDVSKPWKDRIIKGARIPANRTILPRCLRVWAATCLSASWTEHNARVRSCVGARALVRRCACHVSASAAVDTQPHLFPKLIIFPSCRASQWCHNVSGKRKKRGGGRKERKRQRDGGDCSEITIYGAPIVFYKSTTNWAFSFMAGSHSLE